MLDTNICIFLIRERPQQTIEKILAHMQQGELCISTVTLAELEYGAQHSDDPIAKSIALAAFLAGIEIVAFDDEAAAEYGVIYNDLTIKGMRIGSMDALIAAHAKATGSTLVTNNTREFVRVDGLEVEDWTGQS